jgi:hypothetical protein
MVHHRPTIAPRTGDALSRCAAIGRDLTQAMKGSAMSKQSLDETASAPQPQTDRRKLLLTRASLLAASVSGGNSALAQQQPAPAQQPLTPGHKPNILMIMADDIGWFNVSAYNHGIMGYRTPNIDRIAREGAMFTDWYGEQSCTAGRAAFITGQSPIRTGLTKVGLPGADVGLHAEDMSAAEALKPLGTVGMGK